MLHMQDWTRTLRRQLPDYEVRQKAEAIRVSDGDHVVLIRFDDDTATVHYEHDPTDPTVIEDADPDTVAAFLEGAFRGLNAISQAFDQ